MWQSLRPFFEWCYSTSIGGVIRDSTWAFAYIEVFHLFGLTVLLGGAIIMALRLTGVAMRSQTINEVAKETRPIVLGSLGLVLVSGSLLFLSEAMKCYDSPP